MACGSEVKECDLTNVGLRGKVKSVTEKKYHAVLLSNGAVEKTFFFRGEDEWDYEEVFDKKGNFLSMAFLDRDGDTIGKNVYEYGEDGKLAFKRYYENGKNLAMSSQYEYDMLGRVKMVYDLDEENYLARANSTEYNDENLIETTTTIDNKGKFLSQTILQKNKKGYCTDFKYYNDERVLSNWRKEKHDEEGKLLELSVLNPDETIQFSVSYTYNLQGDVVTSQPKAAKDEFVPENFTYEYDKKSNWIKKVQYFGDSLVSVTERAIEYF